MYYYLFSLFSLLGVFHNVGKYIKLHIHALYDLKQHFDNKFYLTKLIRKYLYLFIK